MQPYIGVKDSYAIQAYTQNILHIPNYCPQIRLPLLTIVVETMIQLDVSTWYIMCAVRTQVV